MTQTQITLLQLDNYGPWTVTPEPRPEPDLQALQARIFADLAERFGQYGGYVFLTRYDNVIAVTNGCSQDAHARIQQSIGHRYPVTVSISIAVGSNPAEAVGIASDKLQSQGSAQDDRRQEVLVGDTLAEENRRPDDVHIAHFDIDDVTGRCTDRMHAYDAHRHVRDAFAELMDYMRETHDGLTFFVGGDNGITVCPPLEPIAYADAIEHVRSTVEVDLKVGVGRGRTAMNAGLAAKHALEDCRHNETSVEQQRGTIRGD